MKVLICDSGILINLSLNGLLNIFEKLKENWNGKIIITQEVKAETIDRPMNVLRFKLGAIRIESLLTKKIIEMPNSLNISEEELKRKTKEIMEIANHTYKAKEGWVNIVSEAEVSCVALASLLESRGHQTLIATDERTIRLLCENPKLLEKIMSKHLHQRVQLVSSSIRELQKFKFVRSSEIVFVAHNKGFLELENKEALDAALYATKFKGAAITFEEIEALKKIAK